MFTLGTATAVSRREEIMGWSRVHFDKDPDGTMDFWLGVAPHGKRLEQPHAYSTDIAAAFELVEKMRERSLRPILTPDWGHQWQVIVYRQSQYVCESAWCHTLPEAICLAALDAMVR
jgi:hypothetical protein